MIESEPMTRHPDLSSRAPSPDTQAILLLCGYFSGSRGGEKPLSLAEYNKLAEGLKGRDLRPRDLLGGATSRVIRDVAEKRIPVERLEGLIERKVAAGFALEDWARRGIWILGRADGSYPRSWKRRLREKAPPLLYGIGDRRLLDAPGLGIVGSRDAEETAFAFTRELARRCEMDGLTVISGGARGVDRWAMETALEAGGRVVGILPEGIAKPAASKRYRQAIVEGRLLLVSTVHPGARWSRWNAMGRNKYIYVTSRATVVVSSGTDGGTWKGAIENLENGWVPLFVRQGLDIPEGNRRLLESGARPVELHASDDRGTLREMVMTASSNGSGGQLRIGFTPEAQPVEPVEPEPESTTAPEIADLFPVVWPSLALAFREERSSDDLSGLAEAFGVQIGQLKAWLKQAVEAGHLRKLTQPARWVL